jgi:RES domain
MKLEELELATDLHLVVPTILCRVQRIRAHAGSVAIGPLRLAPSGLLVGRFDLPHEVVGYFAESGVTAVYETLARREATTLSLTAGPARRQLLNLRTTQPLTLLDLRGHANAWPVLQSLRYSVTQSLGAAAQAAGYHGITYRSAQQYGSDCYSIFGARALASLRIVSRVRLVNPKTGGLHHAAFDAIRGSQIPLVP